MFLLVPATIASVDRMLVDAVLCALFAAFVYHLQRKHWKAVYATTLVAPLVRETGLLLLAGVVIAALMARQWKRAALFCTAGIPFLVWQDYVRLHTRPSIAYGILNRPVFGVIARVFTLRDYPVSAPKRLFLWTTDELAIIGYILCLFIAGMWLWKNRGEGFSVLAVTIALFVFLGGLLGNANHLAEAYGYSRPLSPLLLWLMLDAVVRGAWAKLVPPLLVTLGVAIYLGGPLVSIIKGVLL